jgi:hypothetical protein
MKFNYEQEERTKSGKSYYEVNLTAMHGDDEYDDTTTITFKSIAHVYCLLELLNSELAEEELDEDNIASFEEVMREIFSLIPKGIWDHHAAMWSEYFLARYSIMIMPAQLLKFNYKKIDAIEGLIEDILEEVQSYDSIYDQTLFYSVDNIVYHDGTGKEIYITNIEAEANESDIAYEMEE